MYEIQGRDWFQKVGGGGGTMEWVASEASF